MRRLTMVLTVAALAMVLAQDVSAGQAPPAGRGAPPAPTPACGPNLPSGMKNVAKDSRCFELRTYTVREGSSIDLLHTRFRERTTALFKKHGMTIIGYWQPVAKPDTLIYLLAYKDGAARDASCPDTAPASRKPTADPGAAAALDRRNKRRIASSLL